MKIKYIFLGLISVFFLITRIYQIVNIPPSLYWDEASIGYNAYSVGLDLRDEWGKMLPIHFRAFGEFKLPVYVYSVAIFEKVIGLREIAVRLPAVLFSLGSLILIYLLAAKTLKNERIAIISAFFFTVSPWFFIFSRTGYEVTAGVFFFLLGIIFLLESYKRKNLFVLGTISLILSYYSYNSFRFVSPIFLIIFSFFCFKDVIRKNLVVLIVSLLLFLVSIVPIARLFIYDAGFSRAEAFTLFPSIAQVYDINGKPRLQLIYNRNAGISWRKNAETVVANYVSHFRPSFLFGGDVNPRSQEPGFGQIYILDIPLFLLGLWFLFTTNKKGFYLFFGSFLLGILPAALFKESPHALRSLSAVLFLVIISANGVEFLAQKFNKSGVWIVGITVLAYLSFFENYFGSFLNTYAFKTSKDWQYGYKEIFLDYSADFEKYDKIVISDQYAQPYIFALYYLKYSPSAFRGSVKYNPVDNWGFSTVASFGKFEFKKITEKDMQPKTLVFATPPEKFADVSESGEIKFLDGSAAFFVYRK